MGLLFSRYSCGFGLKLGKFLKIMVGEFRIYFVLTVVIESIYTSIGIRKKKSRQISNRYKKKKYRRTRME